jgi:biotin carboxylase
VSAAVRPDDSLPRVAIVHGFTSPAGLEIQRSIGDVCTPIWVIDSTDPASDSPSPPRLLQRFGPVVDIAGLSAAAAAEAVRTHHPDGILAFADRQLLPASRLAQGLALPFDTPEVVEGLIDKPLQRAMLQKGGVAVPPWWLLAADATPEEIDRIAAEATFPVVLKPQRGTTSSYVYLAESPRSFFSILADPDNRTRAVDFIVEEFIPGTSREVDSDIADFVSVESIVSRGVIRHLAVCGKFTLEAPFRGTGGFVPANLPEDEIADVLDVATNSLRALGMTTGCTHTEIKLSPEGARIVEVNGRIGGNIPTFIEGSTGVCLPHLAVDIALGRPIVQQELLPCDRITFRVHGQPPMWAEHFADIEGLDTAAAIPGVEEAVLRQSLDTPVNWRIGAGYLIYLVTAHANDHQEMLAIRSQILSSIRTTFK